jgi:F-type H+-transporting ATPase subunit delta
MVSESDRIGRIADALVALGDGTGQIQRFERDLATALNLLRSHEEIRRFLGDPTVDDRGKCQALERIMSADLHPVLLHFLLILQRERLLARLGDIAGAFYERVSLLVRKVSGEIVTAQPLTDERVAQIEREVGRVLQKDVHLAVRVDPNLLGGVTVRVGSFVVDGTVDRYLEAVGATLAV